MNHYNIIDLYYILITYFREVQASLNNVRKWYKTGKIKHVSLIIFHIKSTILKVL